MTAFVDVSLTRDEQQYLQGLIRAREARVDELQRDIATWQDHLKPPSKGTHAKGAAASKQALRSGNLARPPKPGTKEYREYVKAVKEKIAGLETELKAVQSGEWEPKPLLRFLISDQDQGGVRQLGPMKILQVLGPTEALITGIQGSRYSDVRSQIFWLRDFSTANMADGQALPFTDCVVVEGTKTYTTAGRSTKTVFVVRPAKVDRPKVLAEYRARTIATAPAEKHPDPKLSSPSTPADPE
jgi:hypothetical protein